MTREEAIRVIGNLKLYHDDDNEIYEALNMAIEALKNIQVLDKIPQNYLYDAETEHCLVYRHKYTGKEIHILKPTDLFVLERPHGEWIKKGNNCFCSNCKFELESYILGIFYNFCPNCGSDNRKNGEVE